MLKTANRRAGSDLFQVRISAGHTCDVSSKAAVNVACEKDVPKALSLMRLAFRAPQRNGDSRLR